MPFLKYKVETNHSGDPTDNIHEIKGRIYVMNRSVTKEVLVGKINASLVNVAMAHTHGERVLEVMDCHSEHLLDLYKTLFDIRSDYYKSSIENNYGLGSGSDLLVINHLEINPKFRGKKIGLAALYQTIQTFGNSCFFVAIKAFPLQFDYGTKEDIEKYNQLGLSKYDKNKKSANQKLRSYYASIGFQHIPRTDFMVYNTGSRQPIVKWNEYSFEEMNITIDPCDKYY